MSHISHARELRTEVVRQALQRIRSTGAVIRSQCPIIKGLNDSKEAWIELLRREIYLGIVPYYMFIESSETLNQAFKIPLASALRIHQDAQFALSGLAKTLSGPVISNGPYKILIDGTAEITGEKVFVLKFLQSTDTDQKGSIFFAKYDETATDLEQLQAPGGGDNIVESFSRRSTFGLQD
jgi:L-lysine 2,3-aminomutase